jgi:predicted TIM-barrel enzyme
MEINTYPEMNAEIAKILRLSGSAPDIYAAQYIEELQAEIAAFKASGLKPEQTSEMLKLVKGIIRDSKPFESDKILIQIGDLKHLLAVAGIKTKG